MLQSWTTPLRLAAQHLSRRRLVDHPDPDRLLGLDAGRPGPSRRVAKSREPPLSPSASLVALDSGRGVYPVVVVRGRPRRLLFPEQAAVATPTAPLCVSARSSWRRRGAGKGASLTARRPDPGGKGTGREVKDLDVLPADPLLPVLADLLLRRMHPSSAWRHPCDRLGVLYLGPL